MATPKDPSQSKKRRQTAPPPPSTEGGPQSSSKRARVGILPAGIVYTSTDAKLAGIFNRLADEVSEERLTAAKELIQLLEASIDATAAASLSPSSVDDKMEDTDAQTESAAGAPSAGATAEPTTQALVTKVLRRLVRGVCSSRKAARFGFSITLAEVLRLLYSPGSNEVVKQLNPQLDGILDYVLQNTELEGKPSGQERRDHLFGRLYACVAIIQSEILFTSADHLTIWKNLLEIVSKLAYDVPWLREECGLALCEAAKSLLTSVDVSSSASSSSKPNKKSSKKTKSDAPVADSPLPAQFVRQLIEAYHDARLFKTPEGVALWLICAQSPASAHISLPTGVWQDQDPLSPNERTRLASVLREDYSKELSNVSEATESQPQNKKGPKPGIWKSQPNFSWTIVIDSELVKLKAGTASEKELAAQFEQFWLQIVDNNLFSATASDERKAWGFQILSNTILSCPPAVITKILSPNIMKALLHHRGSAKSYLHQAAATPLRMLTNRVTASPELAVPALLVLLTRPGCPQFDQATKGHAVEKILEVAEMLQIAELVKELAQTIEDPGTKDGELDEKVRISAIENLVTIVKSQARKGADRFDLESPESWCVQLLETFARFGFLTSKKHGELSESIRSTVRNRLNSVLSSFLSLRQPALWSSPNVVIAYIAKAIESKEYTLLLDADETILLVLKNMRKTLQKISANVSKSEDEQKNLWKALGLLFSLTTLQVYCLEGDAVPLAEDLLEFYENMDKSASDFTPLVEVVLSLVAKQSVLLRKLSEQVFAEFTPYLGADALESLISILETTENKAGMQELFQGDDELELDSGDDDVEEIDGEDGSDVEMVDGPGSDSDDDDESEDDDDDEGDDDDELEKFNTLLATALQTKNPHKKQASADSDDSDEDMDDDEMMALDPQLSEIFKKQTGMSDGGKKTKPMKDAKQAKETVVNFKNRVLDLLGIFLKQESHRALCRNAIIPLIRTIRVTKQPQLANKARDVLNSYFEQAKSAAARQVRAGEVKAAKDKKLTKSDRKAKVAEAEREHDEMVSLLLSIHGEALSVLECPSPTKTFIRTCSSAALFVCRLLVNESPDNYEKIALMYARTQTKWVGMSSPASRQQKKTDEEGDADKTRQHAERNQHLMVTFMHEFAGWSSDMIRESWKRDRDANAAEAAPEETRTDADVSHEVEVAEESAPKEEDETPKEKQKKKEKKESKEKKVVKGDVPTEGAEQGGRKEKKEKKEKKSKRKN